MTSLPSGYTCCLQRPIQSHNVHCRVRACICCNFPSSTVQPTFTLVLFGPGLTVITQVCALVQITEVIKVNLLPDEPGTRSVTFSLERAHDATSIIENLESLRGDGALESLKGGGGALFLAHTTSGVGSTTTSGQCQKVISSAVYAKLPCYSCVCLCVFGYS